MLKILLMGGCGLLGSQLYLALKIRGHKVYSQSRGNSGDIKIDPYNQKDIIDMLCFLKPDLVINLIAKTDVDDCERNVDEAFLANTKVIKVIARALAKVSVRLIHISTDQVYTGSGFQKELDAKPENVYALSKYTGELEAIAHGALVLRTNFLCGNPNGNGAGLTNWLFRSLQSEIPIKIFEDSVFNPIHPTYLAEIIPNLVEKKIEGIYNIASIGDISKADLARQICQKFSFSDLNMESISIHEYDFLAKRPRDMRMNVTKVSDIINLSLPKINKTIKLLFDDFIKTK